MELYGVAEQAEGLAELLGSLARTRMDVSPYVYLHTGEAAARHLFAVASGLDSMVLGETEITGQIKTAYEAAQAAKLTGRVLNCAFQRAFQVVKAIRTKTQIGRGATSVGSVAVQLAEKNFRRRFSRQDGHDHRRRQNGGGLHPAHRQKGHPLHHRGQPHRWNTPRNWPANSEGGPSIIWTTAWRPCARRTSWSVRPAARKPSWTGRTWKRSCGSGPTARCFSLTSPCRGTSPAEVQQVENVFLYNMDHLEQLVRENVQLREQEVVRCRAIIEEHTVELMAKLNEAPRKPGTPRLEPQMSWAFQSTLAGYAK